MKPENTFIQAVHKLLPPEIHYEKTNNPYRGGMWDMYYETTKGRMGWIEYKHVERLPPVIELANLTKKPCLSALQQEWGERLWKNEMHMAVILGWGTGRNRRGLILSGLLWKELIPRELAIDGNRTVSEIAEYIGAYFL